MTSVIRRGAKFVRDAANRFRNPTKNVKRVRQQVCAEVALQFRTRGAAGKHGAWKANKRPQGRQMDKSGRLKRSLTIPGHSEQVWRTYKYIIGFGSSVPYSLYHQEGLGVPRRRLVDFSQKQLQRIGGVWVTVLWEGK